MQDRLNPTPNNLRRLLLLVASLGVGAVGWFLLGVPEASAGDGKALAKIDGMTISEEEILELAAGELLKVQRQRHQVLQSFVNGQVRERLVELGAEEAGLAKEEFLQAEVQGKLQAIPAEEVNAFYEARKARIRQPLAAVEQQIREFLAQEALFERLEAKHQVEYLMDPFRVDVDAVGPSKGPSDAPVTIVEFSDFQCPFCSRVNPSLAQVQESYGDKVRIVFRQYPLEMHKDARKAGEASLCAAEQEKGFFWQLHDAMFADQANLGVDGLKAKAAAVEGLDTARFDECLDSSRYAGRVEEDFKAGAQAGVSGTPAFFINGRFLSGAAAFDSFAEIIDEELARSGGSES